MVRLSQSLRHCSLRIRPRPAPVAPALNILPSRATAARAIATANTTGWQAFKASLDSGLPNADLISGGEGAGAVWAANFACGYQCLKDSDPTTAAKYAQRSLGIITCFMNTSILVSGYDEGKIFLGRGDGVTTTFTVPHATYDASTLLVFTNTVVTKAVVKGAANGNDFTTYHYMKPLKVSNTSDGTADYTEGVDWRVDLSLYPGKPALGGGVGNAQFGYKLIDWSLASGNQPATGATYYVTGAEIGGGRAYTQKTLTTDYTVAGNTITFTVAPTSGTCVWAEYLFTDPTSGLAYQQTYNGLGGWEAVYTDDGYPSRHLKLLVLAADWCWDYAGFTSALKNTMLGWFWNWYTYVRDYGYKCSSPLSNYGAGHYSFRCFAAALAQGRDATHAATMASEIQSYRDNTMGVLWGAQDITKQFCGTLQDGFYADGWNYGPYATSNLLLGELSLEEYGWGTATNARNAAADIIRTNLFAEIYNGGTNGPVNIDPHGDGYQYPGVFGSTKMQELWATLAYATTDSTVQSYANYVLQNYAFQDNSNLSWHAATFNQDDWLTIGVSRTATASSAYRTVPPYSRRVRGVGLLYFRHGYGTTDLWGVFHCSNLADAAHQPWDQGVLNIWRGQDDLLISVMAYTQGQTARYQSRYGNCCVVDDFGAGLMDYPSTGDGPAEGTFYGGPSHLVTTNGYEEGAAYVWANGDYRFAFVKNTGGGPPCSEWARSFVYLPGSDYVLVYDRLTASSSSYAKHLQWHAAPTATVSVSGNTWTVAKGSSKAFGATYSATTLTTASSVIATQSNCQRIGTDPSGTVSRITYVTAIQVAPSTTGAMDASAFVTSGDGKFEGVLLGQSLVLFGNTSTGSGATGYQQTTPATYSYTAPGGTLTHYLADLIPGHTYTLSGSASGTATASAAGVLTFTTTGTGSQSVTVT